MKRTGPPYSRPRDKALKALIRRAGSINAIALHLGINRQAVSQWLTVPHDRKKALSQAFPEQVLKEDIGHCAVCCSRLQLIRRRRLAREGNAGMLLGLPHQDSLASYMWGRYVLVPQLRKDVALAENFISGPSS